MNKVLYMVYTMDTGLGGHIYSLKNTSEQLGNDFSILYFGYVQPKVKLKNLLFVDLNVNSLIDCIKIACKESKNKDFIHSFNEHSYFFARISSLVNKTKLILNKCGGKNNRYYPKAKSLVLFSMENYNYFNRKNYTNVYLIPNRVSKPLIMPSEIPIDKLKKNLICISRFSQKYLGKIEKAIKLLIHLNTLKTVASLSIIGTVDDSDVFKYISSKYSGVQGLSIYTEPEYTANAQRHIHYFDLSISAGRSLMESYSYGVPAAIVTESSELPILIHEKNFDEAFYYNFSERTNFQDINNDNEKELIDYLFGESKAVVEFTKSAFEEYFNSSNIKEKYKNVYLSAKKESIRNLGDIILNGLYIYWIKRRINLVDITERS